MRRCAGQCAVLVVKAAIAKWAWESYLGPVVWTALKILAGKDVAL